MDKHEESSVEITDFPSHDGREARVFRVLAIEPPHVGHLAYADAKGTIQANEEKHKQD